LYAVHSRNDTPPEHGHHWCRPNAPAPGRRMAGSVPSLRDRAQIRIIKQEGDGREKTLAQNKPGHWL
jgi:hypothetical protein